MSEANGKLEMWALVELMGHSRIVGLVTEQTVAGSPMLRVDVPTPDGAGTKFTRFFSGNAIYGISPIEKPIALILAARQDAVPVKQYELPQLAAMDPHDGDGDREGDV